MPLLKYELSWKCDRRDEQDLDRQLTPRAQKRGDKYHDGYLAIIINRRAFLPAIVSITAAPLTSKPPKKFFRDIGEQDLARCGLSVASGRVFPGPSRATLAWHHVRPIKWSALPSGVTRRLLQRHRMFLSQLYSFRLPYLCF